MKFVIWVFFEKLPRKCKFHENSTRIKDTLHEEKFTFLIISLSVLLRMKNVSSKSCRENLNTHFMFSIFLNPALCEII